jgi:hypothetical protein
MISPMMVMTTVENRNAMIPARTESANNARSTFTETLPQSIVTSRKFESFLNAKTRRACLLRLAASSSRRSLLTLKKARFKPENIADWEIHNAIPIHTSAVIYSKSSPD